MKNLFLILLIFITCSTAPAYEQLDPIEIPLQQNLVSPTIKIWIIRNPVKIYSNNRVHLFTIYKGVFSFIKTNDKSYFRFRYMIEIKGYKPHSHYQGFALYLYNEEGKQLIISNRDCIINNGKIKKLSSDLRFGATFCCKYPISKQINKQDIHPIILEKVTNIKIYTRSQQWTVCKKCSGCNHNK